MTVKWDDTKLQGELKVKTERLQGIAARQIEALVKTRINELNLIDTGFMINSVYSATPESSTAGQIWDDGLYKNREGEMVERKRVEEMKPGEGEALVHVAAEYFIDWELRYAILYGALQQVAAHFDQLNWTSQ
jgi:hypothetical protein